MEHQGGHLPFDAEISKTQINFDKANIITVAVNNTLTADTVPQGFLTYKNGESYPPGHFVMRDNFDFFKYAGIHRSVVLYTTPTSHIDDITVSTNVSGTIGSVNYNINVISTGMSPSVDVMLRDKEGEVVAQGTGESGVLQVSNAKLWWPYTMVRNVSDAGYLYTLEVAKYVKFENIEYHDHVKIII